MNALTVGYEKVRSLPFQVAESRVFTEAGPIDFPACTSIVPDWPFGASFWAPIDWWQLDVSLSGGRYLILPLEGSKFGMKTRPQQRKKKVGLVEDSASLQGTWTTPLPIAGQIPK